MGSPTDRTANRLERGLRGSAAGTVVRLGRTHREQAVFVLVGGWNTLFGYGSWAALQLLLGRQLPYQAILLLAWPIAVLNAYVGHRHLTFRSNGPVLREVPRFSLVYVATLVANLVILPVALTSLPLNIFAVQAAFTIMVVVFSYLGHKYYSFGI